MSKELFIEKPDSFSFYHTVNSHGWYDLPPFVLDRPSGTLTYVFDFGGKPVHAKISDAGTRIKVQVNTAAKNESKIVDAVRHILRLNDDLEEFYDAVEGTASLKWIAEARAGRLLRSPTVWEDLVKTLCTTNCSWSLTKNMVGNLIAKFGPEAADVRQAFPGPEAMAAADEDFYRNQIRAGYRSPYFVELAAAVAEGRLDPESWLKFDGPTSELKKEIKSIKGIGDYAAENLLKLLGRYDGLALDSWLRAQFYKKHNRGKPCPDKKILRHYSKYADWQGLAIWCDMTEEWFDRQTGSAGGESNGT